MTCGCITFVGLINIVIKKISYRKSVLPINVPTISAQIAERMPTRCRNNEQRQETFELQPVQSHSRIIHVAPIHSEEQSVESLENSETIPVQPIGVFEFIHESEETPVVPVQNFCLNNIKFNPDLIGSAGLTILFVIILIVFYFYVGQIVFADDYETFVLLQHLYYCFPIALPTIYFVVNPKHLITALRDLPCNYWCLMLS